MFGKWLLGFLLPLALTAGLGACDNSNAVQPGVVNTSAASGYRGETGRVVSIREVPVRRGNTGVSDGTLIGGGLGAAGGAAIGAATTNSVGGAVVGGLLGRCRRRHRRYGRRPAIDPARHRSDGPERQWPAGHGCSA